MKILKIKLQKILQKAICLLNKKPYIIDPWFASHYEYAPKTIISYLKPHLGHSSHILDFGCGDGIMALGFQQISNNTVTGIDLSDSFKYLSQVAKKNIGLLKLPESLNFLKIEKNTPFPFDDNYFDGIYSWSVFEHVDNIPKELYNLYRILKPGGKLFIQIEPLFFSPYGSHLKRLIDEPWAHLLYDEPTLIQKVMAAKDNISPNEQDMLYQKNEFEAVKEYLISEYKKLNRVRNEEFLVYVQKTGFKVIRKESIQLKNYKVPRKLLDKFTKTDLLTNEIRLLLSK